MTCGANSRNGWNRRKSSRIYSWLSAERAIIAEGLVGYRRSGTTDSARFRIGNSVCGYLVIGPQDTRVAGLTQAESDVVALLSMGFKNGEIAARRGTSVRTVENQLSVIFKKLGVKSRNELVEFAAGLPRLPPDT